MINVRVKICGLTRERDVADAIRYGADAVGFVFVPASKRFISLAQGSRLSHRVPAFVSRVGLFLDPSSDGVWQALEEVALSMLQFHGQEDAEFCRQFGRPYIKSVSLQDGQSIRELEQQYPDAAGILVDSHVPGGLGGTGKTVDWGRVQAGELPLILAGGLNPQNVAEAVRQVRPWAVDVSSGVEISPGIKDVNAIKQFIIEAKK